MVYRHIIPDMKQRALQLLQEGWNIDEIAETLAVSNKSITRWVDNYEEHGCIAPESVIRGLTNKMSSVVYVASAVIFRNMIQVVLFVTRMSP
jgi:transposase-like protein